MRMTPDQQKRQDEMQRARIVGTLNEAFRDGVLTQQELMALPFAPAAVLLVLSEMVEEGEVIHDPTTGEYRRKTS